MTGSCSKCGQYAIPVRPGYRHNVVCHVAAGEPCRDPWSAAHHVAHALVEQQYTWETEAMWDL